MKITNALTIVVSTFFIGKPYNANYTQLFLNGQNWGVYPNVQQLNGEFFKEWFMSNDGTSWRALKPAGFGGPGGPFGTGYSSLNWLGQDTTDYQEFYTLKRSSKAQPWDDLVQVCDVLNNTPLSQLESALTDVLDVDRTLWFLAHEIIFTDDDSYVYKGGFYIEAVANNTAKTVTYEPVGAEHDVFVYRVNTSGFFVSDVVVNEIMARNETSVADQDGQFDDWIELFNTSASSIDLSGWFLSDDASNLEKWAFPTGSVIDGEGYLIVWADENGSQAGLHTNFKLSGSGEEIYLLNPDKEIGQHIVFGEQTVDLGYARIPNGTGDFVMQAHTFNHNNEEPLATGEAGAPLVDFSIFPNPATQRFSVLTEVDGEVQLTVVDLLGRPVFQTHFRQTTSVDVNDWVPGLYLVQVGSSVRKVVVE